MAAPIANLFDSFNDGTIASQWTVTSGTWAESGGNLCATMPTAGAGITSTSDWSLRQSSAFLEVVSYLNGAGAASGATIYRLHNTADANDYVQYVIDPPSGNIFFQYVENAVIQTSTATTYNAATMRWLRFRHFNDQIYFETSPDGATWTTRQATAEPLWLDSVKVLLFVSQSGGAATAKCFDNFNVPPASSRGVAVGTEFQIGTDGSLQLDRCDQPDQAWGYPCSESAYNALRRSEDPCGLWVQPPAKQLTGVENKVVAASGEEEVVLISLELINPDTCRSMFFYLPLTAGMRFSLAPAEGSETIPVTSWTVGVQVTGVDNPDDGFQPVLAGDFHIPGTDLWRGVADYYLTLGPGESSVVEVAVKSFNGGGSAALIGYVARLGYTGWSEMLP